MSLNDSLLILGCGLLFIISRQIAAQSVLTKQLLATLASSLGEDYARAQNKRDEIIQALTETQENVEKICSDISDIAATMSIIEKYRLPNSEERRQLDEIRFETELYASLEGQKHTNS